MRALTVIPLKPDTASITELPEPAPVPGEVLLAAHAVGVCGTDLEIVRGDYGWAPKDEARLVLGHECVARVVEASDGSGFGAGDWVVPMVRHPDPAPCIPCGAGEWDRCRNGRYTEHGIKERHGFMRERFALHSSRLVKVDPALGPLAVLVEPASVVAKAWEQIDFLFMRSHFRPKHVLITGAGPIGLLAALLGVQRGLDVTVLDRLTEGPKPKLVADLGAQYTTGAVHDLELLPDIVIECTGVGALVVEVMSKVAPDGVVCLTGVSSGGRAMPVDIGLMNRELVLENNVVFGSVNANRRHYQQGAVALAQADRAWLSRLITRTVPIAEFRSALVRQPDDVKVTVSFA